VALAYGGYSTGNAKLYIGTLFLLLCGVLAISGGVKRIKQGEDINNKDYTPAQVPSEKINQIYESEEINQIYESNKELIDTVKDKAPATVMITKAIVRVVPAFIIALFTGFGVLITILSKSFSFGNLVELVAFLFCTGFVIYQIVVIVRAFKELRSR